MSQGVDTEALRASIKRNEALNIFAPPVLLELVEEVERLRDENRLLRDQNFNLRNKTR